MKPLPIRWRRLVTEYDGTIEGHYTERGHVIPTGRPWIDAKAWAVAQALAEFMDNERGECWPSYGTLAAMTRLSRTTVKNGVDRLVHAGLLERKQRRLAQNWSDSNLYRALGVETRRKRGATEQTRVAYWAAHKIKELEKGTEEAASLR